MVMMMMIILNRNARSLLFTGPITWVIIRVESRYSCLKQKVSINVEANLCRKAQKTKADVHSHFGVHNEYLGLSPKLSKVNKIVFCYRNAVTISMVECYRNFKDQKKHVRQVRRKKKCQQVRATKINHKTRLRHVFDNVLLQLKRRPTLSA